MSESIKLTVSIHLKKSGFWVRMASIFFLLQFTVERKKRAEKDILYGALCCVGGLVATAAEIGYIFLGVILFGGIQFVRGLRNS
jgi:hypothetical protein